MDREEWDDWDDHWDDDPPEPRLRRLTAFANRAIGWRNGLVAVWREDDLDVDWHGFARTKGSFNDWSFGGFCMPSSPIYDFTTEDVLVASGGICAPASSEPTWQPWVEYHPPFNLMIDFVPPIFRAVRGGVKFTKQGDEPTETNE